MSDYLSDTSMNNHDDRIETIENTAEARANFGENYGAFEIRLTSEQVEVLLSNFYAT